eukprot:209569-Pleurochrysis_carterae.AAC.1
MWRKERLRNKTALGCGGKTLVNACARWRTSAQVPSRDVAASGAEAGRGRHAMACVLSLQRGRAEA